MSKKIILGFLKSLIFSIVFLFGINMIGQFININIPINIWSIIIVGLLRVPGICLLLLINLVM
ncbi:MAG: pro-sigmaK processing inhibitor BofA family protein [Bacilli bacterium]|nr:pro-sigmaK processing inhibitor BofA family protein [Bacilli bacterium]